MDTEVSKISIGSELVELIRRRHVGFWAALAEKSRTAYTFDQMITLSALRRKAKRAGLQAPASESSPSLRIALVGGSTLFPLSDLIDHEATLAFGEVKLFTGDFNNYRSEIYDPSSKLYDFCPNVVVIIPDDRACRYVGNLDDPDSLVEVEVERVSSELLDLCSRLRDGTSAEIILCNYLLPSTNDPGPLRTRSMASEWNFKKRVNSELGKRSGNYIYICDVEFLAYKIGSESAQDDRSWYESKQAYSPRLQVLIAKEISHILRSLRTPPKKVLVLDLDNTLWGGVIGDDGIEGIEVGDTSPRGEAFKAFQTYILSLVGRGFLLAVCSKNDLENATEPFRRHPEMVLKEEHFVSFKANWEPKGVNIINIARELDLGLDSLVFADDNPAEIENVRQMAPEVETILLGPDPSTFIKKLQDSRCFDQLSLTSEDRSRTEQYRNEAGRRVLLQQAVDMDSYLKSLGMSAQIRPFDAVDMPRIAQLINKSNQFNLTTIRRTEAELNELVSDSRYRGFSVRLTDRFGDHGLISVVICSIDPDSTLTIDTWLMSCRVLKRQVEEEVLNAIAELARQNGCDRIAGTFRPTAKNSMVKGLFPSLGFEAIEDGCAEDRYHLPISNLRPRKTFIKVET